jgi:DNA-binding transcriptional LysR family regulator
MLDVRQLRHFLAIADTGTFTAAAERLHISQPGLSASIRQLERRLGAQLFIRTRRRAELTEAGRDLYAGARRALATLDALESHVRRGPGVTKSTISVGSIPSFAGLELAALISRFTAENPDVDVAIEVGMPLHLFEQVANEEVELAFVTMPVEQPANLQVTPLATYPMVLACPLGHRLASRDSVTLNELTGEQFVDFDRALTARHVNDQAFATERIDRVVRVSCNEIGSLLELVAHGLGLAIVPRPLAIATRVPIALVPLDHASMVWTVAVATLPNGVTSQAGRAMWNLIAASAKPLEAR